VSGQANMLSIIFYRFTIKQGYNADKEMEVVLMQSSKKLVRLLTSLTKILSVLTLLAMVVGGIAVIATWLSPNAILFRSPSEQLVIQTPSLDLIFRFAQERQPGPTIIFSMLVTLLVRGCTYVILRQLHKMLLTVLEGNPFATENAQRLRIIAFVLFTLTILTSLANALSGWWVHEMIQLPGVEAVARFRLDLGKIGIGILILLLAEVFRLGVAMKEEQDLTI